MELVGGFAGPWVEQSLLRNVSIANPSVTQTNANLSLIVGNRTQVSALPEVITGFM